MLLNAVDGMEKGAAIDLELTAAEFPVRSQKEMVPKYSVSELIQHAPAYKAEVGHVFFTLAGVCTPPLRALAQLQGNRAGMRPLGVAFAKTVETGPERGSECAVARNFPSMPDESSAITMAVGA